VRGRTAQDAGRGETTTSSRSRAKRTGSGSKGSVAIASLQQSLSIPAKAKIVKYAHRVIVPFYPIAISLGGTIKEGVMKQFEAWKEAVGDVAFNFMMQRFSVTLLRKRAMAWRFE
jgi:hypothetical protein